jgi:hypothetical protein
MGNNFVEHHFPEKIHLCGQKFDYIPIFCNMRITGRHKDGPLSYTEGTWIFEMFSPIIAPMHVVSKNVFKPGCKINVDFLEQFLSKIELFTKLPKMQ